MTDTYKTRLEAMCENKQLYEAVLAHNAQILDWIIEQQKESGLVISPTAALRLAKKEMANA